MIQIYYSNIAPIVYLKIDVVIHGSFKSSENYFSPYYLILQAKQPDVFSFQDHDYSASCNLHSSCFHYMKRSRYGFMVRENDVMF